MKKLKHKRAVVDKIHYSFRRCDSYNKKYNFIVGPRCLGKSTAIWRKAYKVFRKTGRPCIVLRRYVTDITEAYITSIMGVINKFLPEERMVEFKFTKAVKDGTLDVYIGEDIFIRVHALNVPESRQKSLYLEHPSMIIFDEFICNNANGEKYLKNEDGRFKSLETTYSREVANDTGEILKIYFLGNPYSIYNPYWAHTVQVDIAQIRPGSFIVGRNYIIECPHLSEELKQWCIDHGLWDPEVDDEYNRYAFGGEAVNDANIRVVKKQPQGFALKYVFAVNRKLLAVYKNGTNYWCGLIKETSKTIISVDFDNLLSDSRLISQDIRITMASLKYQIAKNRFTFQSVEAGYLLQSIYGIL